MTHDLALALKFRLGRLRGKATVLVSSTMSSLAGRRADASAALVIPPTTPGSVGDAAMIEAILVTLRANGLKQIDIAGRDAWPIAYAPDRHLPIDDLLYEGRLMQLAKAIPDITPYGHCFMVGADCLDGVYFAQSVLGRLLVVDQMARSGASTSILGSSFSTTPNPAVVTALRQLDRAVDICARDPVSRTRMERALDRPIRQVADLAFLVEPDVDGAFRLGVLDWIDGRRAAGDRVVGVNIKALDSDKQPSLIAGASHMISSLIDTGHSVLLVPHDTRAYQSDASLLSEAVANLSEHQQQRVHMLPPESPGIVKAALARIDLLVTGRMHAAILAMGSGVPAVAFAYQGKFEGLYDILGLSDAGLILDLEQLAERPDAVLQTVIQALANEEVLRAIVAARLPGAIALARSNFRF